MPGTQGLFRRISPSSECLASEATILSDKMATAASGNVQPWSNSKDDYELKEVIGE